MFISERGLELIKSFEGCILQSYDDYDEKIINEGDTVRGTLTIGYGHIEGVYKGQIISLSEAEETDETNFNASFTLSSRARASSLSI